MKLTSIFAVFVSVLVFSGCKKTEDKLILGSWKVTQIQKKIGGGAWENDSQNCNIGTVEEYEKSGSWTYYPGPIQCSAGSGILQGTYNLKADNTKLVFTYNGVVGEYDKTVESITDEQMVLFHNAGTTDNKQFRYTYSKQ